MTRTYDNYASVFEGHGFPLAFVDLDLYRQFRHLPAAGFAMEINRRLAPNLFTCAGGGYVASGSAGPEKLPTPYLPIGA
ncbi:MAG: hypothetical protein HY706_09790 [Candidatus Hydrogenedentes bacterium]|nr:hypothetical protein [Candidatus Hydrogenedentota bacterium]